MHRVGLAAAFVGIPVMILAGAYAVLSAPYCWLTDACAPSRALVDQGMAGD